MCLPSLVTDTMRRFLRLESSKKLQGKNARGMVPTPLGVRGLKIDVWLFGIFHISGLVKSGHACSQCGTVTYFIKRGISCLATKGRARLCLTEARVPSFNGEKADLKPAITSLYMYFYVTPFFSPLKLGTRASLRHVVCHYLNAFTKDGRTMFPFIP